eukprot:COSAG01_NODE_3989_length_5461_cov_21.135660_5_plen_513_part_00
MPWRYIPCAAARSKVLWPGFASAVGAAAAANAAASAIATKDSSVRQITTAPVLSQSSPINAKQPATLPTYDVAFVGGGIVGLASARALKLKHPELSMIVLEKESTLASHQTGHNSGVIHSGVYYKPGSLKAKLCVEGNRRTYEYCADRDITIRKTGKLIVAVDDSEVGRLKDIFERGKQNGVPGIEYLHGADKVKEIEPHCNGVAAVRTPSTGIVDWLEVALSYAEDFKKAGGTVEVGKEVVKFDVVDENNSVVISANATGIPESYQICAKHAVVCGGLHADRLAGMSGCDSQPQIVPFRGDYLILDESKRHLVKGNIYPVPDPRFPFLGVHFTPRVDGTMWLGPNAVLALKREGYGLLDVSLRDAWEALTSPGLRHLAWNNLGFGIREFYRAMWIPAQVRQLQRYIPEITAADVRRGPSGVRAQALGENGSLVDDFIFQTAPEGAVDGKAIMLHCRNAPSPAATSSLAIGDVVAQEASKAFGLAELADDTELLSGLTAISARVANVTRKLG